MPGRCFIPGLNLKRRVLKPSFSNNPEHMERTVPCLGQATLASAFDIHCSLLDFGYQLMVHGYARQQVSEKLTLDLRFGP